MRAVDSHTLILRHIIDRFKNFEVSGWMHPIVENVKFLRCNLNVPSYLGLLATTKLKEKIVGLAVTDTQLTLSDRQQFNNTTAP